MYGPVIFIVKLSILLQYMRIFVPTRQSNIGMYLGILAVFWAHLLFYIIDTFFQIFSCNPREKAWNKLILTGHCFDLPTIFVASGAVNVVSDFAVLILPIYSVWRLKITTRQKIQVSAAFATGLVVGLFPASSNTHSDHAPKIGLCCFHRAYDIYHHSFPHQRPNTCNDCSRPLRNR
jgi:hypothetical protein